MKGVLLAGGRAKRLGELTQVTNKHLLAVYNQPMIFYPLQTLVQSGVKDIMIISSRDHVGAILRLLGSGERFGCHLTYRVQENSLGIANALSLAEDFVGQQNCAVVLGDNVFESHFAKEFSEFEGQKGARIFLKSIADAQRFGVAELDAHNHVLSIEEKPAHPKSNYAVTGLYLFDCEVFNIIRNLKPSARGEYEITDVNNAYIASGSLKAEILEGDWTDAGTFESLFHANTIARKIALRQKLEERSFSSQEAAILKKLSEMS